MDKKFPKVVNCSLVTSGLWVQQPVVVPHLYTVNALRRLLRTEFTYRFVYIVFLAKLFGTWGIYLLNSNIYILYWNIPFLKWCELLETENQTSVCSINIMIKTGRDTDAETEWQSRTTSIQVQGEHWLFRETRYNLYIILTWISVLSVRSRARCLVLMSDVHV